MRSHVFSFVLMFLLVSLTAQSKDPVLMTINGSPVTKSEFEYIYNKNNSNNSLDKKTLSEYVDLFVNFKLKVQEAKAQGLDTTSAFINELNGYRTQLTKPYLTDQNVDEQILSEAYNRMKEDVEVSHILIRVAQNASAADTLTAWKKITSIAKRLEKEDFKKVAKETSEDPSAEKNSGYIGWISAFHTLYPFETMAYNTPVGNFSKPFRTAFGYHILKVQNRRNSLGEILVAHIMRFTTEGNDAKNKDAKIKIDSLYKRVQAGDDFGKLALEYSEDRGSASHNGELPWFGTGRMIPEFENAAFALQNTGDVSAPVKSGYGWHIIKLLDKKPIGTYESLKPELERRIKQDVRAGLSQKIFVEKLKKEYNFSLNTESAQEFVKLLGTKNLNDSAFCSQVSGLNKTLFTFAGKTYLQNNFSDYLAKNNLTDRNSAQEIIDEKLNAFAEQELLAYENSQLESKYEDFRFLMQEYHDGILLFEVSNNEVWEKASKDIKGLENYFNTHKTDYTWEKPHYKGKIIYCKDKATYNAAKAIVRKLNADSIEKYLPLRLNDSIQHVKVEKGLYAQGDNKAIDRYGFKVKNAVYEPSAEYPYIIVVGKNLKNSPENYTDVRGLVTADYQDYLEKTWIAALRAKYPVVIDQTVLKTIKQN